ncbi:MULTISPECIES: hypothetical protein [Sorangium]|uniref:Outer membrane lipoprotein BamD-like domain-containing protein n=1 Tax=Sorangium cellulosum TaxID=56 RepID=A0A4P2QFZ8_SORCE|nr:MULTISPECIES: hypothetical protein [Sorangium]AUX28729.1 uncharacterized protein SOCE836_008100 [Sorangium cellulosum]WCQ88126.1 hypothetical protein NQZ70_00798 [Sorangium sp. Soce836]
MSDPERLLDQKGSDLQTALLRAALDESVPSGLTRRTLVALGVAAAAASAGGAAAASAGGAAAASAGGAAAASAGGAAASTGGAAMSGAATGGAAAAASGAAVSGAAVGAAAGGGILSAFGIGVLAGVLTLGVVEWTGVVSVSAPERHAQEAPSAPAAFSAPPARRAAEAEARRVPEERADEGPPPAEGSLTAEGPIAADEGPPLAAPAAPAPAAPAANSPRAPEKRAPTLASELALLDTARRALRRGDPAAALALLDRHAREFAGAQLTDEAAVIRVEALASQGDRAGAHAAARRFLEAHPGSPHAKRIESAAGIDARDEFVIPGNRLGD